MQTVQQIAAEIVAREGGFVDDPDDPGGATKYGVTIHTMRRLGLDLSGDRIINSTDVRMISRSQAVDIFVRHYFELPRLGLLPQALQPSVFDMYVNAGSQAVKILQRLLRDMGYGVAADGLVGPKTAKACKDAAKPDPETLRDAYGVARRNYYFRLADRRPASRKYARTRAGGKGGWIRRGGRVPVPELSPQQCRVSKEDSRMGLISDLFSFLFGGNRNIVRETVEIFHENTEKGAERSHALQQQAMVQFGSEFQTPSRGFFDRFMDGLNRLPRPAMALGTLGLFVAAMVDPVWFAARMQGIALVPEPLWWLLGVIVSFYFGARHQAKVQDLQREISATMRRTPQVLENLEALKALRADSVGAADPGSDAELAETAGRSEPNPALEDWRRKRAA